MREKIFIGSSTESSGIAKQIKDYFISEFDCTIWEDHFFQLNQSTYDNLIRKAAYFDYAIFVGGIDDFTKRYSDKKTKKSVRDNVYFELGLYTGILSKSRTYFFVHKGVQLATDMLGITVIKYKNVDDIRIGSQQIREKIREEENLNRITLLPSTSLAINYFRNFLEPIASGLSDSDVINYDNSYLKPENWKIQIVIPQNCNKDWKIWANEFYKYHRCGNLEVCGKPRKFSVKIDVEKLEANQEISIIDVPQTLRGSFDAVDLVVERNFIGSTDEIIYMKEKEVLNFIKALSNLIEQNPLLHGRVKIVRLNYYTDQVSRCHSLL